MMKKAQMIFRFRERKRRRPGRPKSDDAGVWHVRRPDFSRHHPVHVTLRTVSTVGYLRRQRVVSALEHAFRQARVRFGMRIVHYSIRGNHVHLVVEANNRESLAKGMQGLAIRVAKTLNRVLRRNGRVWADRYHAHVLKARREVANALRYVLGNFSRHAQRRGRRADFIDAFSSIRFLGYVEIDAPVAEPSTWLLRVGWRP
jgi:REP element-mobilizing transposase RayT